MIVLIWILMTSQVAHATNESQAAMLSLLIGPGAKINALGGSFVTLSQSALCAYYNPAGLAGQRSKEVNFSRSKYFYDICYNYVGCSFYWKGLGNVGIGFMFYDMGKQIYTTKYGIEQGTFHSYEAALSFSYGTYVSKKLTLGATLKFLYSHLAEVGVEYGKGEGSSFAVDIGLLYYLSIRGFRFGMALRNVGPKLSYVDVPQAKPLPSHFTIGASWKVFDTEHNDVLIILDLYKPLVRKEESPFIALISAWTDESLKEELRQIDLQCGLEYTFTSLSFPTISLRVGYSYDKDGELRTLSFGGGFEFKIFGIKIVGDISRVLNEISTNDWFSISLRL